MLTVLAVATTVWALVMACSPVLQIRRIQRQRSSRDISLGYWYVLLVGFALWTSYGIAIGNVVLILPNTVALIVGCITVAVVRRHRPPAR